MTADPAHISVTAKVSAYYRKFSDIAFAAEVAMQIFAFKTEILHVVKRATLRESSPRSA